LMIRLAILPGDGVGPEVTDAALTVLRAVAARCGLQIETETYSIGAAAIRQRGVALPSDTLAACLAADAVLLGAVGDPSCDDLPVGERPEAGLLALRRRMEVFANLRPARLRPALAACSPITSSRSAGCDLVVVRELLGGLYFGEPRGLTADGSEAWNTLRYTAVEVDRIARTAFQLASTRRGLVTSVDKANVLETSRLWRMTVDRIAAEFPRVRLEHRYVDAFAMELVLTPARFDVVLTENLFGDILSDEAGAIVGSLGLLPSASLGAGAGLFEPVHGSAPTLAGRDAANPIGAIASIAMMLEHGFGRADAAACIEAAIDGALADGIKTADIVTSGERASSCSTLTNAIAERI